MDFLNVDLQQLMLFTVSPLELFFTRNNYFLVFVLSVSIGVA